VRPILLKPPPNNHPFKKYFFNQKALSLIEVLVSLVLISIVLTTFFSFFSQATTFSGKNEKKLVADNLTSETLSIIQESYQTTLPLNDLIISCGTYPKDYPTALKNELHPTSCYYNKNNKHYYPEITVKKQTSTDYTLTGFPEMYVVNVKMFDSADLTKRKLLSEAFGYIGGR
jgi:prepilin-type N-terminal cleavage/methylation domain-containing protein